MDEANHLDVAPSCLLSCLVKVGIRDLPVLLSTIFINPYLSPVDCSIIKTDRNVLKDKKSNNGKAKKKKDQ